MKGLNQAVANKIGQTRETDERIENDRFYVDNRTNNYSVAMLVLSCCIICFARERNAVLRGISLIIETLVRTSRNFFLFVRGGIDQRVS